MCELIFDCCWLPSIVVIGVNCCLALISCYCARVFRVVSDCVACLCLVLLLSGLHFELFFYSFDCAG